MGADITGGEDASPECSERYDRGRSCTIGKSRILGPRRPQRCEKKASTGVNGNGMHVGLTSANCFQSVLSTWSSFFLCQVSGHSGAQSLDDETRQRQVPTGGTTASVARPDQATLPQIAAPPFTEGGFHKLSASGLGLGKGGIRKLEGDCEETESGGSALPRKRRCKKLE
jgi:hypothetical protein